MELQFNFIHTKFTINNIFYNCDPKLCSYSVEFKNSENGTVINGKTEVFQDLPRVWVAEFLAMYIIQSKKKII